MDNNSRLSTEMLKKCKPQVLHIDSLQMDHGLLPGPCLLLLLSVWEGDIYLAKAHGEIC